MPDLSAVPSTDSAPDAVADSAARAALVLDAHWHDLHAYARVLMRSSLEADDLCQDVALEVLRRPETLLAGERPGAYLRGIARHLSGRIARWRPMHAGLEAAIDHAWSEVAEEAPDLDAERARLQRCLAQLAPRARTLIAASYERGEAAPAIAERLGLAVDAVRMALMRARLALAACMGVRRAS